MNNAPKKTCLITQEADTRNQVIKYSYDESGRLIELNNHAVNYTRFFYDSLNNISKEEFWEKDKLQFFRRHFYDKTSKTDSVFEYKSMTDTFKYLINVFQLNHKNLPVENKYYMGNTHPVHAVYFEYDSSGNLVRSIEAFQNGRTIFKNYKYDNKESPYPKLNYQYIPLWLSKNNVTEVSYKNSSTPAYETYNYIYNKDGYPLKKAIRNDEFVSPQFDTLTYSLLCD